MADDAAEHGRVRDAIRDYWKLRYDLAKQIGVVSGVLLAVLVALYGVFYPCTQDSDSVARANRRYKWFRWVPVVALVIGVVCLLCFAALNLGLTPTGRGGGGSSGSNSPEARALRVATACYEFTQRV